MSDTKTAEQLAGEVKGVLDARFGEVKSSLEAKQAELRGVLDARHNEIKSDLEGKHDKVKALAEEALGKAQRGEDLSNATKELADEALTALNEAKARLDEVEQKLARRVADDATPEFKTIGEQVVADLPPSEWPNFYFRNGHEGGMECRGSTSRKRSSASCVKRRSCWRRAAR